MHAEAYEWVRQHSTPDPVRVLDLGGRNINGSVRPLFPNATRYVVVDQYPGDGVDVVADAATWDPPERFDVVVCTEVFEHTASWREIIATAFAATDPGGVFVATMAGPGRPAHSAIDGGWSLHPGEHYANIHPADLSAALLDAGWVDVIVDRRSSPADVRCFARRAL